MPEFVSLLERSPSTVTWRQLCDELDRYGHIARFTQGLEPSLQQGLMHWPDEMRVAPSHWVDLLLQGEIPLGLSLIKTLRLHRQVDDTIWIKLMNHPSLAHLTRLEFEGVSLDENRARFLAHTTTLTRLESLSISSITLSSRALDVLLSQNTAWHDTLTSLTLSKCELHDEHLRKLASSTLIERLECLDLSRNKLGPFELSTLIKHSPMTSMQRLLLSFNQVHEAGLHELLSHDITPQLTHLDLYANALPSSALNTLLTSRNFESLTSLSLGLNRLSPDLIRRVLPQSPLWQSDHGLTHLNLDFVQTFDRDAMMALGAQGQLDALEHLSLSGCMLNDEVIHTLIERHALGRLRKLELDLNAISSYGLHSLCSAHLPALDHLVLAHNAIDAHAANVLPHASWVPHTSHLDLRANIFDAAISERLRQAPSMMLIDTLLLD